MPAIVRTWDTNGTTRSGRAAPTSESVSASRFDLRSASGSWRRDATREPGFLSWDELAAQLIPYVQEFQLLAHRADECRRTSVPMRRGLSSHRLLRTDVASRFARIFKRFVDRCHQGNSVLMDWVPVTFLGYPRAGEFDGSALYEHADPRQANIASGARRSSTTTQ